MPNQEYDPFPVSGWAAHRCSLRILNHAESEHGMFGMVTALIVEE